MPVFKSTPAPGGGGRRSSGGGGSFLGSVLNEAENLPGQILHPASTVVPDLIQMGRSMPAGLVAFGEHPIRQGEAIPGQMFSQLTDPSEWYNHPAINLLNVAQFAPVVGAGARGLELGRVLGETSSLANPEMFAAGATPEEIAAATPTRTIGEQARQAILHGPPVPNRVIYERPTASRGFFETPTEPRTSPQSFKSQGMYFSPSPSIRAGQRLVDLVHETYPNMRVPGLWRSQAARIEKAQFTKLLSEKGRAPGEVESHMLVKQFGKAAPDEHEAIRLAAYQVDPAVRAAYIKNEVLPKVRGFELKNAQKQLARTEEAAKYIEMREVTTPPTMETVQPAEGDVGTTTPEQQVPVSVPKPFREAHIAENPGVAGFVAKSSVVLNPERYDKMLEHATRASVDGRTKAIRDAATTTVDRLNEVGRPAEKTVVPPQAYEHMVHPGGTYMLPYIKDEFTKLKEYERLARLVSNIRTNELIKSGDLEGGGALQRILEPKNLIEGHGIIPNIADLKRNLNLAKGAGHTARAALLEKEIAHWEGIRGGAGGQMSMEIPEEGRPHPLTDPALAKMGFRVPDMPTLKQSVEQYRRSWRGGKVPLPSSLTHAYQGVLERRGGGDPNVARVVAASHQEASRFLMLSKLRTTILASARPTPAGLDPAYAVPIVNDYWEGRLPAGYQFPEKALQEGANLSADDAEGAGRWFENIRQLLTEKSSALQWAQNHGYPFLTEEQLNTIPVRGVRWVDKRMFGGLDKQNPLFAATDSPIVRKFFKFTDAANEAQKAGLLYLKPSYLGTNMLGNVGLALTQQGFLAPLNLTKSFKVLFTGKGLTPEAVATIKSGMGQGLSGMLDSRRSLLGRVARGSSWMAQQYGKVIDDPFRFSSFLHEADVAGFRSADQIEKLTTDPALADKLTEVFTRANDGMINYERMGPGEQAIVRRLVFFYPWLKGSSRYGYQLFINHPGAAAFSSTLAQQGHSWQEQQLGALPDYLSSLIPLHGGQSAINPTSAAILQQPADLLDAFSNMVRLNPNPSLNLLQNLTPADAFLYTAATGNTTVPHRANERRISAALNEGFGGWPLINLIGNLIHGSHPKPGRLYPNDTLTTQLLRWGVSGGLTPREINKAKANYTAWQQEHPTGFQP